MIRLGQLRFGYDGSADVLRLDEFALEAETNVLIVGRSGCGKTTLLRLTAGLLLPTGSSVVVDGQAHGLAAILARRMARQESLPSTSMRILIGSTLLVLAAACSAVRAEPIRVVAAEKVYGDIAAQIGGANVAVTSILTRPSQDPHEFEASAATARLIADARLVIYNGGGYDPWALKLLSASKSASREVIEVAGLTGKKAGDNPHFWYESAAVSALVATLAATLTRLDPVHRADYAGRVAAFETSMGSLREKIAALRIRYAGSTVTATEPVFDYMADALGLKMRNGRFQLAVMNGTEPSAAAIAAFERDLRTRAVKALLYNTQTGQAMAERMRAIANQAGVPVVAITETEPEGKNYQEWMASQLDALERALGGR